MINLSISHDSICLVWMDNTLEITNRLDESIDQRVCKLMFLCVLVLVYFLILWAWISCLALYLGSVAI